MKQYRYILWCTFLFLWSCSSDSFEKNPVDVLMRDMTTTPVYSIMLYDMDEAGTFFKEYKQQYRIIKEDTAGGKPEEVITDWYPVSKDFFDQHINDMGMEIAAKGKDGEVTKTVAPPGYNNYVGNPQYGHWQQGSNGNSFWAFYGQYAFMSSLFNMAAFPIRRSYYNDYRGSRSSGRPYYGPDVGGGRKAYGTGSAYTSTTKPNSTWRRSASSRQLRNSRQRTSRSGTRYNSGGSMRSRGGGFGK